ncbi:MAG TPA: hypothetical protein VFN71_04575 [Methylomirabilota bacterium]|nr:hypothetical protein [Methylomirabilota bacterium]
MDADDLERLEGSGRERRIARSVRPRRPWLLIAACVLLVILSALLWSNWRRSRLAADDLRAELKKVYAEAESLRMEAALAKQRITQLERELRALAERERAGPPEPPQRPRGR